MGLTTGLKLTVLRLQTKFYTETKCSGASVQPTYGGSRDGTYPSLRAAEQCKADRLDE